MTNTSLFAEVEVYQEKKRGQAVCGDAFFSKKLDEEDRVIGVVSDGLGSGIKANILANMTGTMALRFAASNLPLRRAADIIMDALPICRVRRISYATFTIVDATLHGATRIVEMDTPPFLLLRNGEVQDLAKQEIVSPRWPDRIMHLTEFQTQPGDRVIVFSDGVTQAGLGSKTYKLGWRLSGCIQYVQQRVAEEPDISARDLAHAIVKEAVRKENGRRAHDDITCAVFYFRPPRRLLVLTGPPFDAANDHEVALRLGRFPGRRTVCGGTTATLVARELKRSVHTPLGRGGSDLPAPSQVEGIDLVTEGILTLTRTAQYLDGERQAQHNDAAARLAELLRESDDIRFLVGTRINEAHQDPSLPIDLDIRRNIVKRIRAVLTERYLKQVNIEYI